MGMLLTDIAPLSLAGVLVGIGALAAGIGIFRAGFALGHSFGRVVQTVENAVGSHLEAQQKQVALMEKVADCAPTLIHLVEGQSEILKAQRSTDTSLRALWKEYGVEHAPAEGA